MTITQQRSLFQALGTASPVGQNNFSGKFSWNKSFTLKGTFFGTLFFNTINFNCQAWQVWKSVFLQKLIEKKKTKTSFFSLQMNSPFCHLALIATFFCPKSFFLSKIWTLRSLSRQALMLVYRTSVPWVYCNELVIFKRRICEQPRPVNPIHSHTPGFLPTVSKCLHESFNTLRSLEIHWDLQIQIKT